MGEAAQTILKMVRETPRENAVDRIHLFNLTSKRDRKWIMHACADGMDGFILWLRAFMFTYNPRTAIKHLPFVPWPMQVNYAERLFHSIDTGHDILADKSRDVGATWLCLYSLLWWWMFAPDSALLVASRKETYVDEAGNPDCLFWKIDYAVRKMPPWMQPPIRQGRERTHMHLLNPLNGSVLDGETTNTDLGRGGRRKAILLDEFAAVENGREILAATADTSPCRIFNSTPKGQGNAFAEVRFSGKVEVVTLHWTGHPEKSKGKYEATLPDGTKKWRSPWYDAECARRVSKKEIAQELDCDYLASGDTFFDLDVLQKIRADGSLVDPKYRGEVQYICHTREAGETYEVEVKKWVPDGGRRRLSVWCPLLLDPNTSQTRPAQNVNYVAFADIALGQGQSNSVLDVWNVNKAEQVAQFVCPDTPPHEFAQIAVAICKWFGGACGWTYLGWENNGPGLTFGREVIRAQYPFIYHQRDPKLEAEPIRKTFGWTSTRDLKTILFGDLRRAIGRGEIILHEKMTVTEMERVIFNTSNEPIQADVAEENSAARANHGDRVIAAAGCVMLLHEHPKAKPPEKEPVPMGFEWRRQKARKKPKKYRW